MDVEYILYKIQYIEPISSILFLITLKIRKRKCAIRLFILLVANYHDNPPNYSKTSLKYSSKTIYYALW